MMSSTKVHLLKLFRVICAYGDDMINRLRDHGMFAVLKTCVFVQENCITVINYLFQCSPLLSIRFNSYFHSTGGHSEKAN